MVGSVIVHNGIIIGEGYHIRCGEPHAEVNAINAVKDKSLLPESTLYVNLEPCAHFGRTPPCADLIVKHNIKRVVIGCIDSFSEVSGRGIERMRKHGIQVDVGILEKESLHLNRRFFHFHRAKQPYIILKWAQTLDGFIDIAEEKKTQSRGTWITNHHSKQLVHKWRMEESAILAGTNTIIADDPMLTIREWSGNNPTRIVIDRNGRIPKTRNVFDGSAPTLYITPQEGHLAENAETLVINNDDLFFETILNELYKRDYTSLFVEGGTELLQSLIDAGTWNEARVFIGNKWFGGGVKAPRLPFEPYATESVDGVPLFHFCKNKI